MLQMGENPISEEEFENFITVIIRFLVRFGVPFVLIYIKLMVMDLGHLERFKLDHTHPIYLYRYFNVISVFSS